MFVFKHIGPPTFGFFILNRLGAENNLVYITETMEIRKDGDYVVYRGDYDGSVAMTNDVYQPYECTLTSLHNSMK